MKRRKMNAKNDYFDFVNSHNNRTNVYTTVYDFQHFTETMPVEDSVIIDRIFLDFDAHEDNLDMAWRDVKVVMEMVIENDYLHTLFFSGRGFHLFLFGKTTKNMRNVQTFFREIKQLLDLKVGKKNMRGIESGNILLKKRDLSKKLQGKSKSMRQHLPVENKRRKSQKKLSKKFKLKTGDYVSAEARIFDGDQPGSFSDENPERQFGTVTESWPAKDVAQQMARWKCVSS